MENPMGEARKEALRVDFDSQIKLEFHGAAITSDAGLVAYRELDEALGLTATADEVPRDSRHGKNTQHELVGLLRQSVYSRLAGYEDTNDAQRLAASYSPASASLSPTWAAGPPVWWFYNLRGTAEQWIKEGKNAVKSIKLSCHDFVDNQVGCSYSLWRTIWATSCGGWRCLLPLGTGR